MSPFSVAVLASLLLCGACMSPDSARTDDQNVVSTGVVVDTVALTPPGDGFFLVVDGALRGDLVAVAEWSSSRIHMYSTTGTYLRSIGGRGEGPGEFGRLGWVELSGNQVVAGDQSLPRTTRLTSGGEVEAIVGVGQTPEGRLTHPRGTFDDGMMLATVRPEMPVVAGPMSGPVSPTFDLVLLDAQGSFVRNVGKLRGAEFVVQAASRGGTTHPSVFGRGSGLAVRGRSFYTYDPVAQRVHRYDQEGRVTGTYGSGVAGEEVTKDLVATVRARLMAETPAEEQPELLFDGSPVPTRLPLYGWASFRPRSVFAVSSEGDVWMVKYGGLRSVRPEWEVYAPDGTLRGVIVGPARSWILDLDGGRALLHVTDQDGVESVQLVTFSPPSLPMDGP